MLFAQSGQAVFATPRPPFVDRIRKGLWRAVSVKKRGRASHSTFVPCLAITGPQSPSLLTFFPHSVQTSPPPVKSFVAAARIFYEFLNIFLICPFPQYLVVFDCSNPQYVVISAQSPHDLRTVSRKFFF